MASMALSHQWVADYHVKMEIGIFSLLRYAACEGGNLIDALEGLPIIFLFRCIKYPKFRLRSSPQPGDLSQSHLFSSAHFPNTLCHFLARIQAEKDFLSKSLIFHGIDSFQTQFTIHTSPSPKVISRDISRVISRPPFPLSNFLRRYIIIPISILYHTTLEIPGGDTIWIME
jgi:hypothetical protein